MFIIIEKSNSRKLIMISWGVMFLILAFYLAFYLPVSFWINFYDDDGFFYIKTALNSAIGFGSTFDTINQTNGYHPLWYMVLVGLFYISNFFTSANTEFVFRLTNFFQLLIQLSTFILCYKLIQRLFNKKTYFFLIFLFLTLSLNSIRNFGTETHIIILVVIAYLYTSVLEIQEKRNFDILKILLLILLFLSRIDYIFSLIPSIIFISALFDENKWNLKKGLKYGIPLVLTVLIYFTINYLTFGHLLTISGTIKNTFPQIVLKKNILVMVDNRLYYKIFVSCYFLVSFAALVFLYKVDNAKRMFYKFLLSFSSGYFLFFLLNLSFNYEGIREWYLGPAIVLATFTFLFIIEKISTHKFILPVTVVVLFVFFLQNFYSTRISRSKFLSAYEYSLQLQKVSGANETIFQIDHSGLVGFFSERNLINGDGLINSFEYINYIKKGQLERYFQEKDIDYYSTYSGSFNSMNNTITDTIYSKYKFGGYNFIFCADSLVLQMKYLLNTSVGNIEGNWMLIKL